MGFRLLNVSTSTGQLKIFADTSKG